MYVSYAGKSYGPRQLDSSRLIRVTHSAGTHAFRGAAPGTGTQCKSTCVRDHRVAFASTTSSGSLTRTYGSRRYGALPISSTECHAGPSNTSTPPASTSRGNTPAWTG